MTRRRDDREAARTLVGDARQILDKLQTERSGPLPISSRALRRCDELSAALARSVEKEGDAAARVRSLYHRILSRDPEPAELKVGLGYLNGATVEQFAQVLLATNEEMFWP